MKKLIAILLTVAIILSFTIPAVALATGSPDSRIANITNVIGSNSRRLSGANKAALADLRTSIQPLFAEIKVNNAALQGLFNDNKALRAEIKAKLKYLKQDAAYTLPQAVKDELSALKPLCEALTATKGGIKDILAANKDNMRNLNFNAVKASYDQIITIQKGRSEDLTGINGILRQINDALPSVPI